MKPFLKWVGGKRKLIPQYEKLGLIPKRFNTYYEPFLGGGAMFFYLAGEGLVKSAFLSDLNEDLVVSYQQVKHNLLSVKGNLKIYAANSREILYNLERKADTSGWQAYAIAARFIYLNKSCRSGIWRVNSKGEFNVPIGDLTQTIYQPELLDGANKALNSYNTTIVKANGLDIAAIAQPGDFVFIDPPYDGTYSGYTKEKFGEQEQIKLSVICKNLVNIGVKVLVCNSDTSLIRDLYSHEFFNIYEVERSGAINSDLNKRQKVKELVIAGVNNNE